MDDNNKNNDNWSNRNWQDARGNNSSQYNPNDSMFDNIFRNNRTGGWFGAGRADYQDNQQGQRGFFTMPGNNGKIGGNWMRGRNSLSVIVIVLIVIIIYTFYSQFAMNEGITKSTIERTAITSTFDYETDDCVIDLGATVEDEEPLRHSFMTFHRKSGVIPYIYILPIGDTSNDVEKVADEQYDVLINDEDHFFVVLQPDGLETCKFAYRIGENAKTVMDPEAVQIFTDYLNKYYASRQTNNQTYLVSTYGNTGDRIMSTANFSVRSVIFGIIVILILVFVIIYWIRKKKSQSGASDGPNAQRVEQDMNRRW